MVVAGNTSPHAPPSLNLPTQSETPPKTLLGRLLLRGRPADEPEKAEKGYPWYVVLWLPGVDYFSSLGYQPGIALLAAGALSVPVTAVLVLVHASGLGHSYETDTCALGLVSASHEIDGERGSNSIPPDDRI